MNQKQFYQIIRGMVCLLIGSVVGSSETLYFIHEHGWHTWPINVLEGVWDLLSIVIWWHGVCLIGRAIKSKIEPRKDPFVQWLDKEIEEAEARKADSKISTVQYTIQLRLRIIALIDCRQAYLSINS